jgi:hypothetical protein
LWGFLLFTGTYLMVALGPAAYIPELFPTENRMRGSGVASAAGRVAGTIAPQIVVAVYVGSKVGNVLAAVIGALVSSPGAAAPWDHGEMVNWWPSSAAPDRRRSVRATFCPMGR